MDLLSKFTNKVNSSNQEAILFEKKVVVPEPKKEEMETEDGEGDNTDKFGVDLDCEDTPGTEWLDRLFSFFNALFSQDASYLRSCRYRSQSDEG